MTHALTGARPRAVTETHPRLRRAAVAMSLTAALAGGTLVAGAQSASAAPTGTTVHALGGAVVTAKKPTPRVSIAVSRKTGTKGKAKTRPVYTVKATRAGDPVKGRVKVFIDGRKVSVKKLGANGVVRFRPSWDKYDVGRNRVRLVTDAAPSTGLADVTKQRTVRVKPKATSGAKVVSVAQRYVGSRYVYGGSSPRGFDCSGFTSYVYKKATGKSLPRSSSAQRNVGHKVSRSSARPGDIVYTPGHVAIYAGNGKVIEAGNPRTGVVKRHMWQSNPTFIRV